MRFTKMQGTGNDYIYVNCFEETVAHPHQTARIISDRHFGVGSDGLVLIGPGASADFSMRIINRDGSESEMCGNACRCIGKYVYERGLTNKTTVTLETGGGVKVLHLTVREGKVESVRVDMGQPEWSPEKIPVALSGQSVLGHEVEVLGKKVAIHCVSMGNPHCVVFVENTDTTDVAGMGAALENHPLFPRRTNVEFVQVVDRTHLRMRVWERGAGETLACGTGACASLAAAVMTGRADRLVQMQLLGGELTLEWSEQDGHIHQQGPAEFVFDGVWTE